MFETIPKPREKQFITVKEHVFVVGYHLANTFPGAYVDASAAKAMCKLWIDVNSSSSATTFDIFRDLASKWRMVGIRFDNGYSLVPIFKFDSGPVEFSIRVGEQMGRDMFARFGVDDGRAA